MARLRYLNTFIDEESCEPSWSSRSWPLLPGVKHNTMEEGQAADYVAVLNQIAGLEPAMAPEPQEPEPQEQAQEQACEFETEMEVEEVNRSNQTGDQIGNQIGDQIGNQESPEAAVLEGHHFVLESVIHNLGSHGHPFLCRRPCIRFAKGSCEIGDACGYCHMGQHSQFKTLDKRQRLQVREMETRELLAVFVPHIRRSVRIAGVPAAEIVEMIEEEVGPWIRGRGDQLLDQTLRQMSLSALLACITGRDGDFPASLRERVEALRLSLA